MNTESIFLILILSIAVMFLFGYYIKLAASDKQKNEEYEKAIKRRDDMIDELKNHKGLYQIIKSKQSICAECKKEIKGNGIQFYNKTFCNDEHALKHIHNLFRQQEILWRGSKMMDRYRI
jgi:hypothetical protein